MRRAWTWAWTALRCLLGIVAIVAVLLLAAWGALQSEAGRAALAHVLESQLGRPGELEIAIGRIDGPLPQRIRLERVALRDAAGPWLAIDAATLEWRPWALLEGRVHVEQIVLDGVAMERAPAAPSSAAADDGGPAIPELRLPVEVVVDRVAVETLTLGAAVLGQRAAFGLDGRLVITRDAGLDAHIAVERRDAQAGRAAADIRFDPATQALDLAVRFDEPGGGLIGQMLQLPGAPPVHAEIVGRGPIADWSGRAVVQMGDAAGLAADIAVARPGPLVLRMSGAARLAALVAEPLRPLLAPQLDFTLEAARDDAGGIALRTVKLATPAIALTAQARLDADDRTLDARADLAIADGQALAGLAAPARLARATARIDARGPVSRPQLHIAVAVSEVAAPGFAARAARIDASIAAAAEDANPWARIAVDGTGAVEGVSLDDPKLAAALGDRVDLQLRATADVAASRLSDLRAGIRAGDIAIDATGAVGFAGAPEVDAVVTAAVPSLARLAPLAGAPIAGAATAEAKLRLSGRQLDAAVTGRLRDLDMGQPAVAALAGPEVTLRGHARRGADGTLRLDDVAIDGAGIAVAGEGALRPDGGLAARYRIRVADLARLAAALGQSFAGRAALEGSVAGTLAAPRLEAKLAASELRAEGHAIGSVDATLSAEALATAPTGRLELAARTPHGPVRAATRFALPDPGRLLLSEIELAGKDARIAGELTALLSQGLVDGRLQGRIGSLSAWQELAGMPLGGSAELTLEARPDGGRQGANVTLAARDLSLAPGGGEPIRAARIEARLQAKDLTGKPGATFSASADTLRAGAATLRTLSVEGDGGPAAARFRVTGAGEAGKPFDVALAGRFEQAGNATTVTLDRLTSRVDGRPIALRGPMTLRHGAGRTELSATTLALAGGTVTASGSLAPGAIVADLRVQDLPLSLLALVAPELGADGAVTARVRLEGAPTDPRGEFRVEAQRVRFGMLKVPDNQRLRVTASGNLRGGRLAVEASAGGPGGVEAEGRATLPLRVSLAPFAAAIVESGPVSGQATLRGELARLSDLLPPGYSMHRIAGRADLSARLAGTPAAPRLEARVTLERGEYENLEFGTLLRGLELDVASEGSRVVVRRLAARDGGSGRLSATGHVDLDPARPVSMALDLSLDKFVALRRDDVTAIADVRLALAGTTRAATLRGTITTQSVEARLPNQLPPEVVALDVVEVNGPRNGRANAAKLPPKKAEAGSSWLALDIGVAMPQRVFVRGRGLDSEWAGDLKVTGAADRPVVTGALRPVRGQFELAGKTFRLSEGRIGFDGGATIDPMLNLSLRNQGREVTAIVNITGPASKPSIEFTSVPEMPRDEVLSRVLFNKGSGRLSALEAVQLANALATLSGRSGGPGALDRLRGGLGLDVVRVGGGAKGTDPTLGVGKYIAPDVYVGVEQGTKPGSSATTVEIELTPNVTLETGVGADAGGKVGVKWKWDY